MFFRLALKSLINRKGSVALTILAMSVSIFVLLGVEHIRTQTKQSFNSTVSGVDLIVGARTGSLNLLLYSVFRIGSPTNNIDWQAYQTIANHAKVAWAIPISLGDSHKGYRVMGTSTDYFKHFSYGNKHQLTFTKGKPFSDLFDVVLGSEVATKLGYSLGDKIVLAHGLGETSFSLHDDKPFKISGILAATGTPVDQTVHVSLQGIEAIHLDWQQGVRVPGRTITNEQLESLALQPKNITAFMLGLNSRMATFRVQRDINNYHKEPLTAILPGVALSELWQMMGLMENTLRLISGLILTAALLGLSAMMLASIREREHEIHLLRVIGAPPIFLFLLIEMEALLISLLSILLAISALSLSLISSSGFLVSNFGLHIGHSLLSGNNLLFILIIIGATFVAAALPSFLAYKNAKSDR
ncbi:ABC transporter permease [uncultured Oceanicoccus sp.]|uniref:ABC transporter permease n=1 Tax=uncultured Oceanicoccus sp. TaxID=1706381 RepID=UPI0030D87578